MKLIFNIEPLFGEPTGVGNFTQNILKSVARQAAVTEIQLFAGHRSLGPYSEAFIENIANRQSSEAPLKRRFAFTARLPDSILWLISRTLFWLRSFPFRDHIYVETNSICKPFAGKTVVFCHDLSVIHYRRFHPERRVAYFDAYLHRSIEQADIVTTISAPIAREIETTFGKPCRHVIPPGVTENVYGKGMDTEYPVSGISDALIDLMNKLDGFILTVGSLEPRKNLGTLVNAFTRLPVAQRTKYPLVFVGPSGWHNEALKRAIDALVQDGQAYLLGYLNQTELAYVYSSATLYAYLSHYEGFGIPVIEAMSSGVPVLISEDPALVDTAGGAAEVVDAGDTNKVVKSLQYLLASPERREELKRLGERNIKRFSWQQSAEKLVEAIKPLTVS